MKTSELSAAVLNGRKLVIGQYRDFEVRTLKNDKAPNEPHVITSAYVLVGREVVSVEHFADRGTKAEAVERPKLKPGELVCIEFSEWTRTKYGVKVRGTIEPLAS